MPYLTQVLGERYQGHDGQECIARTLDLSLPCEVEEGLAWYRQAYATAEEIADRFKLKTGTVCAVIARLSPQTRWDINVRAAVEVCEAYVKDRDVNRYVTAEVYPANIVRALSILETQDYSLVRTQTGPKIEAFFDCIRTAGAAKTAVVDTWSARVWLGKLDVSDLRVSVAQHRKVAADYVELADTLSYRPADLQAIVWVAAHRLARGSQGSLPFGLTAKL